VTITLDLPTPPSVNRTRKIDWKGEAKRRAWVAQCDKHLTVQRIKPHNVAIAGRYQATISLPEDCPIDPDNGIKALLDYVRRVELVRDDSRKYLRRLVVEFGEAPEGVRVELISVDN
jgi:Holliday junction resolvase RusA-like endonuclease